METEGTGVVEKSVIIDEKYWAGIKGLMYQYTDICGKSEKKYGDLFNNTVVPLEIFTMMYRHFISRETFPDIKTLDEDYKSELRQRAKRLCPNADNKKRLKICQALYLLDNIVF